MGRNTSTIFRDVAAGELTPEQGAALLMEQEWRERFWRNVARLTLLVIVPVVFAIGLALGRLR